MSKSTDAVISEVQATIQAASATANNIATVAKARRELGCNAQETREQVVAFVKGLRNELEKELRQAVIDLGGIN